MRPVFAALLAMMLVVATTSDRVACIDGCTDDAQQESASSTTPSLCGLCHGWNGPQAIDVVAPAALTVAPLATNASRELPAHVTPPDHPPRLADIHQNPITRLAA